MAEKVMYIARTIMIPIVVSDVDGTTFLYYWKLIAMPQDKVLLVHVFSPKDATKDKWTENQTQLSTVITPFEEQCKQHEVNYQVILHTGKPGEGICKLVEQHNPDLLIIGSRGLSKLRRTIETSVSEYVHHHAKIPILIVPHDWRVDDQSNDGVNEDLA